MVALNGEGGRSFDPERRTDGLTGANAGRDIIAMLIILYPVSYTSSSLLCYTDTKALGSQHRSFEESQFQIVLRVVKGNLDPYIHII